MEEYFLLNEIKIETAKPVLFTFICQYGRIGYDYQKIQK